MPKCCCHVGALPWDRTQGHANMNYEVFWICSSHLKVATIRQIHPHYMMFLSVREITKISSTFSATNISSNIVWLLQLHDTIQMKFNFGTKFSSIYLAKVENVWFFDYHSLTCSMRKMVHICLMQNIYMCLLYKSHQIARLVSHLINHFSQWIFTV